MKFLISYLILFSSICPEVETQTVKTSFIFNNSKDRIDFGKNNTLSSIQNSVNSAEFVQALVQNYSLSDKNIKIDFVFFDRGQISRFRLKDTHSTSASDYSTIWSRRDSLSNRILFLFVKDFGSTIYRFDRLELSDKFIREHIDRIVLDFIREHLSGDFIHVVQNGCKYLAKAITPVWTQEKIAQARILVTEPRYLKGHCVSEEFDLSYYDFKPLQSPSINANADLYDVYDKGDNARKSHYIKVTSEELNGQVQLKNEVQELDGFSNWNPEWTIDKSQQVAIIRDDYLAQFVKKINENNEHDPVRKASEWTWVEGNDGFNLVIDAGFVPRNPNNKVEMFLARNEVGSAFPIISPYRKLTWCNVFAKDLAKQILFGFVPWNSNECANRLHFRIEHDKQNFREIDLKKAWELTKKGFIVYLSAFNSALDPGIYLNKSSEKEIPTSPSGHIATCFPEDEKVVQAGAETKIILFNKVWSSNYGDNYEKVKANLYLGFILK